MLQMFSGVILWAVLIGVVVPIFGYWLVIKYIFHLRQKQNEQFLNALGNVVRDAVIDALDEYDYTKNHGKRTSWATYNSTKSKPD